MTLVSPGALPATVQLLTMPMASVMAAREACDLRPRPCVSALGPSVGDARERGATFAGAGRLPLGAVREPRSGGRARELVQPQDRLEQPDTGRGRDSFGGNGHRCPDRGTAPSPDVPKPRR